VTVTLTSARSETRSPVISVGVHQPRTGPVSLWLTEARGGPVICDLGLENLNQPVFQVDVAAPAMLRFGASCMDPRTAQIVPFETELQLRHGDAVLSVLTVVHIDQDLDDPWDVITALDLTWFLSRLLWGGSPWAKEWLTNPNFDFDPPLAAWSGAGEVDGDVEEDTGGPSIALHGTISQSINPEMSTAKWGAVVTARVWISEDAPDLIPEVLRVVVRGNIDDLDTVYTAPILPAALTPRGTWTTLTVQIPPEARPAAVVDVEISADDDAGDPLVWVSRASFRMNQVDGYSPSELPPVGVDARDLIVEAVRPLRIGFRKQGVGGAAVGIDPDRYIAELIAQAVELNTSDFGLEVTATTRTIVQWTPRRGRDIPTDDLHLTFALVPDPDDADGDRPRVPDPDNTLAGGKISKDYTKARTEVVGIGEEGYRGVARDPDAWGGQRLQDTMRIPTGTPLDGYEDVCRTELRADDGDVQTWELVPKELPAEAIEPGDRVRVDIDYGTRQVHGMMRILRFPVDLDTMTVGDLTVAAEPGAP